MTLIRSWRGVGIWTKLCAIITLLLILTIGVSYVLPLAMNFGDRASVRIGRGVLGGHISNDAYISYSRSHGPWSPNWHVSVMRSVSSDFHPFWRPIFQAPAPMTIMPNGDNWIAVIPLGYPAIIFAALTGVGFYLSWRERRGKCKACGYDRTGIGGAAVCPECGAKPGT